MPPSDGNQRNQLTWSKWTIEHETVFNELVIPWGATEVNTHASTRKQERGGDREPECPVANVLEQLDRRWENEREHG